MLGVSAGGEDDAWQSLESVLLAHLPKHIETAQLGHHQVEQHQIHRIPVIDECERFFTVVGDAHAKWALLQLHLDDAADMRLVVSDEDV